MTNLIQLNEQDFNKMALEIENIGKTKSEEELFQLIGNALHDIGMTVSTSDTINIMHPKIYSENGGEFDIVKSLTFVADTKALKASEAKKEGKNFWHRFKEKLNLVICNDSKIKKLLSGNGEFKDYLKAGIPLVLAALGASTLNPVLLAILAAVFALISKVGFEAYCKIS